MITELKPIDITTTLEYHGPDACELSLLNHQFCVDFESDPTDAAFQYRRGLEALAKKAMERKEPARQNVVSIRQTISQPVRPWRGDDPGAA